MKPITGYKEFFATLDKAYDDMKSWANDQHGLNSDTMNESVSYFYATDNDSSNKSDCKVYKPNPLLWTGKFSANRNGREVIHERIFLWFTQPNYNGKANSTKTWDYSEKLKVIHSQNGYDFCIVRDNLRQPTDNYWGYKFVYEIDEKSYPHKFVIRKKGDLKSRYIFECFERWELENYCTGAKNQSEFTGTASDIFRYFNPFKIVAVPFNKKNMEMVEDLSDRLRFDINRPKEIWNEFVSLDYVQKDPTDKWLICLMGISRRWSRNMSGCNHNATWWIMTSKTKPTTNEALEHLMDKMSMYYDDCEDDFTELLIKLKSEFCMDLNKINLKAEKRMQDLYARKMWTAFKKIMGTNYNEVRKFWDENYNN